MTNRMKRSMLDDDCSQKAQRLFLSFFFLRLLPGDAAAVKQPARYRSASSPKTSPAAHVLRTSSSQLRRPSAWKDCLHTKKARLFSSLPEPSVRRGRSSRALSIPAAAIMPAVTLPAHARISTNGRQGGTLTSPSIGFVHSSFPSSTTKRKSPSSPCASVKFREVLQNSASGSSPEVRQNCAECYTQKHKFEKKSGIL